MKRINFIIMLSILILTIFTVYSFLISFEVQATLTKWSGIRVSLVNFYLFYNNINNVYDLSRYPIPHRILSTALYPNDMGLFLILTEMSQLLGIYPSSLILMPFGILSVIIYFALCKRIFRSEYIVFFLTFYYYIHILASSLIYGDLSSWAVPLFLLSILLSYIIIEKRGPYYYILLLFLAYLGTFLYWHTIEAYTLVFIISLNLIIIFTKFLRKHNTKNNNIKPFLSILAVMVSISIFFGKIALSRYGYISQASLSRIFDTYTDWLFGIAIRLKLIENKDYTSTESIFMQPSPDLLTSLLALANLLLTILILVPIFIGVLIDIKNRFKNISKNINNQIKWSLILTQFIIINLYAFVGGISTGIILWVFPILAVISLLQLRDVGIDINIIKKLIYLFLCLIIILQIIGTTITISNRTNFAESYVNSNDIRSGALWFFSNSEPDLYNRTKPSLADFSTGVLILVEGSKRGFIFNCSYFTPNIYIKLFISNKSSEKISNFEYLFVDMIQIKNNKPLPSDVGWKNFKPISNKKIEKNKLTKIYDDSKINIYKFRNK